MGAGSRGSAPIFSDRGSVVLARLYRSLSFGRNAATPSWSTSAGCGVFKIGGASFDLRRAEGNRVWLMKTVSRAEAWTGVADCRACQIRASALFSGLEEADFEQFHRPIDQLVFAPGTAIYSTGDAATSLFTLRKGLVKLTQFLPDGTQRIVRLLRQSDLVGLEAMLSGSYEHTAVALHPTEVCRLPVELIKRLSQTNPKLYQEMMARWHRALSDADRWITEFSTGQARHRVIRLLLWLSEMGEDGRCDLFSREDLGAALGLTTETSSRVMAELKRRGLIAEPRPNHIICDRERLRLDVS